MFYLLNDDHSITPCTTEEWHQQTQEMRAKGTKHVGHDIVNGYKVSTIWLGFIQDYAGEEPILFETMVLDDLNYSLYCNTYSTWQEAQKGHQDAIQWVLDGCKVPE